jgi:ATP-binding cassette subfamily A (ABC1) protein 3
MIVQAILAFAVLVYVDSGAPRPRLNFLRRRKGQVSSLPARSDVTEEKDRVEKSGDVLRVVSLTKRFTSSNLLAVDDVTFGVAEGTNFALIGPNGAGKTTTLGCIRGVVSSQPMWMMHADNQVRPTSGDIQVDGHSLQNRRNLARSALGVCAQTNAIDSALTGKSL